MNEQVVSAVHCAGQHQVGLTVVQAIARQLNCVQTAGACRVECHGADTEVERTFQHERREPRHEPVAGVRKMCVRKGSIGKVDRLSERGHTCRWKRQVAEHGSEARRIVLAISGVAECFACGVECPLEDRVEAGDLVGRETEAGGVEHVVEARDVASAIRPDAIGAVVLRVAENVSRSNTPSIFRDGRGQVGARHHAFPKFDRRHGARQHAGAPHDGDWRKGAHRSARVMH